MHRLGLHPLSSTEASSLTHATLRITIIIFIPYLSVCLPEQRRISRQVRSYRYHRTRPASLPTSRQRCRRATKNLKKLFYMFIRDNDLYCYLEGVVTEEVPVASMAAYPSTNNLGVPNPLPVAALKRISPSSSRSSFHSANSLESPCLRLLQLCHHFSSQLLLSISQASLFLRRDKNFHSNWVRWTICH